MDRFRRTVSRFRQATSGLFIAVYLAAMAGFTYFNVLGEPVGYPFGYFWTWDMFPNYTYTSYRRFAVGRTAAGKYVDLLGGAAQQFRGGTHHDLTRVDLERAGGEFRRAVEKLLARGAAAHRQDPIVHVYLLEQSWPDRYNYSPPLYRELYGADRPRRRNWRVVQDFPVAAPASAPRGGT
jgi:hypothetical protein